MSGYTKFAVVGAGRIGNYIVQELLKGKAAGTVKEVAVLTRQVKHPFNDQVAHDILSTPLALDMKNSKTIEGDAKVIQVDYSNEESIKNALTGVDVVISTIAIPALDVQRKIAAAAKNTDIKLFVPSEFGHITEGETAPGLHGTKADIQRQLRDLGVPFAAFYTGPFADSSWSSAFYIDTTSGKVQGSVGGDGNKQISFTSRLDVARYVAYILTHLPPERLKNRCFTIAGDNKSFNEIFKAYKEKTGKEPHITYIPISELDARLTANPDDIGAFLHKLWATVGPFQRTDNDLYPDWNPTPVIDLMPVA